jgi:hypothetical protein
MNKNSLAILKRMLPVVFLFITILSLNLTSIPVFALATETELSTEDFAVWFDANSSLGTADADYFGAYVMEAIGEDLYLGFSSGVPIHSGFGPLLAKVDSSGTVEVIGELNEQDIMRMRAVNGRLYIPGYDPNSGEDWDAGNFYIYDPDLDTLTKLRYQFEDYHFVDATTTDSNGNYSFSGLKPTAYQVNVINPEDYDYTTQLVGSPSTNIDQDSNVDSSGIYNICADQNEDGGLRALTPYTDNSIDAGLVSSPANPAGTPNLADPVDNDFYTGDYTIGDLVWEDTDTDGIKDPGETGLAGVRVELYTKDPHFACIVHNNSVWGSGNTIYSNMGTLVRFEGSNFAASENVIYRSTDAGVTWERIMEEPLRYFSDDLLFFNGYFYKTHLSNDVGVEDTTPFFDIWLDLGYSSNLTTWQYTHLERGPATFPVDFGGDDYRVYSASGSFRNNLEIFRNYMTIILPYGDQIYKFTSGIDYELIDANNASFGDLLGVFNDPDLEPLAVDAITGADQRYNAIANGDDEVLYVIGDGGIIYGTTNFREWAEVADFSAVGSGASPISIEYWPAQDWLMVSTAGTDANIYYLDQQEILDESFGRISHTDSALSFRDSEETTVNLENEGTIGDVTVEVLKSNKLIYQANATFSNVVYGWSSVIADTSEALGKTVVRNLGGVGAVTGGYIAYVPIGSGETSDVLTVCPEATNLGEITATCTNLISFSLNDTKQVNGQSVTATKNTIEGSNYWVLTGLQNGGAASKFISEDPEEEEEDDSTGGSTGNTGNNGTDVTPTPTPTASPTPTEEPEEDDSSQGSTGDVPSLDDDEPEVSSGFNYKLLSGSLALIGLIIVAIIYFRSRKSEEENSEDAWFRRKSD